MAGLATTLLGVVMYQWLANYCRRRQARLRERSSEKLPCDGADGEVVIGVGVGRSGGSLQELRDPLL